MQRIQKKTIEKLFIGVTGIVWVAGLLIAGSDSPYMPWLNGVGLILFFCASMVMGKLLNPFTSKTNTAISPKFFQKADVNTMVSNKKNERINTRYALGA